MELRARFILIICIIIGVAYRFITSPLRTLIIMGVLYVGVCAIICIILIIISMKKED